MKTKILLISAIITLIVLMTNCTFAATYYVATNGSDSYTTTQAQNINTPWKTINTSVTKLVAGDILYVMTGTYVETVYIGKSGITLSAYPGNSPVIDGGTTLPAVNGGTLIYVAGNNNTISSFEVKNCNVNGTYTGGTGIQVPGNNNTLSKINVHHAHDKGFRIVGNYNIVEDSKVWQTCLSNVNGSGGGSWGSGLSAGGTGGTTANYNIVRRNTVFNNWGEGLNCWQSDHCTVEDNIVYDNWTNNLYLSDATNCLVQRNMVYISSAPAISFKDSRPTGITMADEVASYPRSANNTIINNFIYNTNLYAFAWTNVNNSGLNNVLIANNTIVNGRLATGAGGSSSIVNANSQIRNNIIGTGSSVPSNSGITFSNNCWSTTPPAAAAGANDVTGNPQVAQTGSTSAGALTADFFKLLSNSPAIDKAMVLIQVTEDYFKTPRGSLPDIGGHEYTTGDPNPSFCNSALAPVIDGVAENIWTQIESDTLKNIMFGTVSSSADLFATYKAVWDNTALYLLVKVKDDTLKNDSGTSTWDDDAVEIFIDGNNDKAASYDANDHQYIVRWNDATVYEYHSGTTILNPAGVTFSQGANAGGYLMEIKITWSAIGVAPASGKLIGFDMLADDDDNGGAADASMSWFMQPPSSHHPSDFGTIELSGISCVETPTGIINEEMNNATLIYPNPFNTSFVLKISDETILKNAMMKIYDVCGKEVKAVSISSNETIIDRGELPSGIYFYSVINNNEKTANGKLIVQ
ncbi:MAG: sugar-binding protein [Bacteroidales bacterium]|jgi:parallel beta-helix repeat protein